MFSYFFVVGFNYLQSSSILKQVNPLYFSIYFKPHYRMSY